MTEVERPTAHKKRDWNRLFFELLVVFLGVTAGFLLNNWQLEQKDRVVEERYLDGFLQDVSSDIEVLSEVVERDSLWVARFTPRLEELSARSISVDSAQVLFELVLQISKVELKKGTYEDIINSGNLNLLGDYDLKKEIVDFYLEGEGVTFIEDYLYEYFGDFVMPYVLEHMDILQGSLMDPDIRLTKGYSNLVVGYYSMVTQRLEAYSKLLGSAESLKKSLEGEN